MAYPFAMGPLEPQPGGALDQVSANLQTILGNPLTQTALLNAGISLMQPPQWGEGFTAQLGRAIGAGGEALRSAEAQELARKEQESKAQLRESSGYAAEQRAQRAGAGVERDIARYQLLQSEHERKKTEGVVRAYKDAQTLYQKEAKDISDRNVLARPSERQSIPSFEEWLGRRDPRLAREYGELLSGGAGTRPAPGAQGSPGTSERAIPFRSGPGGSPLRPDQLRAGQDYDFGNGVIKKWNGTGFD